MDANGEITLTEDSYKPWYLGEPNGNDEENCGVSWVRRDAWNDEGCFRDICGFCELEQAPVFTLRGKIYHVVYFPYHVLWFTRDFHRSLSWISLRH